MKAALRWAGILGMTFCAGCVTTAKAPLTDSAVVTLTASDEQLVLGKHRAEAIYSRWSEEEKTKFVKRAAPLLAVRTLGFTPEQAASLGAKVPAPETAVCVVLWDARAEKIVGSECYVVVTIPERNQPARFSTRTAQYVGSL